MRDGQREHDLAARLGGDEFLVVLSGLDRRQATSRAQALAEEYRRLLCVDVNGSELTVSVGVSTFPADGADFDSLLHAADLRMYSNKAHRVPA